ncbi:MAG: hypothetical protein K8T89_08215 [Planctomycetes bacterium]|nr:hypothetical protein [Planctomycetota bacterium]
MRSTPSILGDGRFLFLGMTAQDLCARHECRIVHFMIHDRVSFGGSLIAIGMLYQWLTTVPLRQGQAWAWRLLLVSGVVGFGSFFAYLGYGYLDTWHGLATLALLPCFVIGLIRSYPTLTPKPLGEAWRTQGIGRACLLITAAGMIGGGLTIFIVGMTHVFVPEDLIYMGVRVEDLHNINERLVPLIAHDRAGFGGAVCCCGVTLFFTVWCATPSASLWRVLCLAGITGFGTAIGVHPAIGYNDAFHLAPAVLGAGLYVVGLILAFRPMFQSPSIEEIP